MKNKERLRKCYRLEESKESWQLHAIWDSILSSIKNRTFEKKSEIRKRSVV